ncbi:MAG: hypothetical protein ACPKOI_08065 [Pleomorphochaeta sp.]
MKNNKLLISLLITLFILLLSSCSLFFIPVNDTQTEPNFYIKRPILDQKFIFSDFITFEFDKTIFLDNYEKFEWIYKNNTIGKDQSILSKKASYFGLGKHTVTLLITKRDNSTITEKINFSVIESDPGIIVIF